MIKRCLGIVVAVLLLCILASKNWFVQKHAATMTDGSAKPVAVINNCKELQTQEAFAADSVAEHALKEEAARKTVSHGGSEDAFRVSVLSATPGRTRFRFELGEYTIREEQKNGKNYSRVQVVGSWETAAKGKPVLPVIRRDFIVAKGRQATLRILDVKEETVVCSPPSPSIGMVLREETPKPAEEDPSVYGGDAVYPSDAVAVGCRYVIRGAEGLELAIHPMRYDFGGGVMVVTRSFEAEITDEGESETDYAMRDDEWNFRRLLARRFANGNLLRGGEAGNVIGTILYIAPDRWTASLSDFAAWKERLGYNVTVAGYPSITGEGKDSIASFIHAAYQEDNVSHVILIGDRTDIPPYEVSRYPNNPSVYSPTTDTPYSWVDGEDNYADLFLSRMSVTSSSELAAVCAKIMAYEQAAGYGDWRGTGLFIGSSEKGSAGVSNDRTDSSLLEEERVKLSGSHIFDNMNTLFATEQSVTAQGIGNQLDAGNSLVYYLGHGRSDRWTTGLFDSSHAAGLLNGEALPFVASFCCSTANFAYKQTSLAEAFLRNVQGGAVGFLGATSETYWNPPIYAMRQMTADIQNRYDAGRLTCLGAYSGAAVMAGIDYIHTADKSEGTGTSEYFAKQMILMGDCSTMGRIGTARNATVAVIRANADSYCVTVAWEDTGEPVQGAAVCAWNANGMERCVVRSDENGQAVVSAFAGKTVIVVSDAGWGFHEETVNIAVAMDTDMDGNVSNAEAIAYLNALDRTETTAEDLAAVAAIWERGGDLSMTSRMAATRGDEPDSETVVKKAVANSANVREPGGDEPPLKTRTATPMVYWEIDQLNRRLEELCMLYPEVCREQFVGRSVEGRDIMALRISCHEGGCVCPELMVAAGIHGNERIGTWMAMRLAEAILADLAGDEADSVYRPLLSRCALWIIPAMNPDGASAASPTRENAYHHDMNRSFPDGALQTLGRLADGDGMMSDDYVPTAKAVTGVVRFPASEVPETTAFMRFCMDHPCMAALHLHSGSLVVGYPYGNNAERRQTYTAAPEDEVFRVLADSYCEAYDGEISHINTCKWYPVDGEAPDWQYRYTGTLAMTVELLECKEPRWLETCESAWQRHKGSFAAWLANSLDVASRTKGTKAMADGVHLCASLAFQRLMPEENGILKVVAKGTNGATGGACILNMVCETGLAAVPPTSTPSCVIGSRTESDGSISWLLYSLESEVDETLEAGVRTTDGLNNADHIVSIAMLSSSGENLLLRRQVLLAEKRNYSWQLEKGWNFIASPLLGESLLSGGDCLAINWNGKTYTKEKMLDINDFRSCRALWVYSEEPKRLLVDGRMGTEKPVLRPGWNAVGSLYYQNVDRECFAVEGGNAVFANWMLPGMGYWVFVR